MTAQPPSLTYDRETYLTVSTQLPPAELSSPPSPDDIPATLQSSSASLESSSQTSTISSSSSSLIGSLRYVGPVGKLGPEEHLFKLPVPSAQPTPPAVQEVMKWLEEKEGVQAVEVMVPKKRAKKMFEGHDGTAE